MVPWMPKFLIFAGAGASKAVNAERFPTTVQFFERLPDHIVSDPLFRLVVDFLRQGDAERPVDIEEVLWELQELRTFADSVGEQTTFIGYGLSANRFTHLIYSRNQNQSLGVLDSVLANLQIKVADLIGRINAVVYELYNYEPNEVELGENWLYLLDKLAKSRNHYHIFTTNYDIAIEAAVATRGRPSLDEFSGLSGRVSKWLDIDRWKSSKQKSPQLTKLHGSINWKFGQNRIQVGDPVYTGDHKKQAIIYPGFKGQSDSEFFLPLHNFLGDSFEEADALVFIGFAFRDQYINELISDRVRPGSSIYIINPAPVEFPMRRLKPKVIKDGFGKKSIDEMWKDFGTKSVLQKI